MKDKSVHRPSTEKGAAISLPLDGVAAETRSSSFRRASKGRVSIRRVPSLIWGEASGVFLWSSTNEFYPAFFWDQFHNGGINYTDVK